MRFFFQRPQPRRGGPRRTRKFAPAFEALEQRALLSASVVDLPTSAGYGSVAMQSHSDGAGNADETSSCWIRTAQVHTGGDIDRPVIVGRVYNAQSMPPFGLPGSATVSGWMSNSSPGSGHNTDDEGGREMIRIHAQYDLATTVEHDDAHSVGGMQTVTVGAVQTVTVGRSEE